MIQLKTLYTPDFIEEYSDFCLNYIRPRLDTAFEELEGELRERLELYFSNTAIRFLLSSDAFVLEVAFEEIFESVPILAERFNPKLFFSSLNVNTKCDHLNLRTNEGKLAIENIKRNVLTEVNAFLTSKPSILLGEFVGNLNQATKAGEIKSQLGKLTSIVNGTVQANDNFKAKFPHWLECLSDTFNYDYVIARFGTEIVNLIDLNYCPYCADESIEPLTRYRPAIDHYFP
ncbi:hypothetical protein LH710_004255, partial [Vibrio vulnificus]|nr:hypothetical protein [Vibrio vulnificus]